MAIDPVQKLIEYHELHQLKARYFRYWDGKEFDKWLDQFTEDATFEVAMTLHSAPHEVVLTARGKAEMRDTMIAMNAETRTVHRGHTPEFDLISDTEAAGIWAMDDIIERKDMTINGSGYYHETYRKVDGKWRFASIRLTRLRYTTISR